MINIRSLHEQLLAARVAAGTRTDSSLSDMQLAVLLGLTCGESMQETAQRIGCTADGVKSCRRRLYQQLGAANAAHAVAIAMRTGLLRTDVAAPAGGDR